MCASFAPPKANKPTFAVGKGPSADAQQSSGTGRRRSPSPVARAKQKITLDQLSPLGSINNYNNINNNNSNNTVTPSTSRAFTTPVSPADGGGTPRVTYFPSFTEIARGVIRQEASSRTDHDPFARARARAAAEEREQRQERERLAVESKRRRTRRKMGVVLALLVVVVAWRWFDYGGRHPPADAESKKAALAAQNKATPRGGKAKDPATVPPPGFFSHLATDMPAIASSKAELTAILKMSRIKAKPRQVDLAWSALTSGEARPTDTLSFWGDRCGDAALTAKVFLAGVLRSPGMAAGSFLILVVTVGAVFGGVWWAGEGDGLGRGHGPGGGRGGDRGGARLKDHRGRGDAEMSNGGGDSRYASLTPRRVLSNF